MPTPDDKLQEFHLWEDKPKPNWFATFMLNSVIIGLVAGLCIAGSLIANSLL